jgi:hypothetical protein
MLFGSWNLSFDILSQENRVLAPEEKPRILSDTPLVPQKMSARRHLKFYLKVVRIDGGLFGDCGEGQTLGKAGVANLNRL